MINNTWTLRSIRVDALCILAFTLSVFSANVAFAQIRIVAQQDTVANGSPFQFTTCEASPYPAADQVPKPLFRDPVHDGAADPVVIWNRQEEQWYMIYTVRRADVDGPGYGWVFGSDVGVATSADGLRWLYRGTLNFGGIERGHNTHWAPEVMYHEGTYHMYLSYHSGVPDSWWSGGRMAHLTSANLWDWHFEGFITLSSNAVIDACVAQLPDGGWRMWYKDRCTGQTTWSADSDDLYNWTVGDEVISDEPHEGPNVFHWQGSYWMVTDPWKGLGVYKSDDAEIWEKQGYILSEPGQGEDESSIGQHADVYVTAEGRAYIFYHVHPGGGPMEWKLPMSYEQRRSSIQVAELKLVDGKLTCDRDADFSLNLTPTH